MSSHLLGRGYNVPVWDSRLWTKHFAHGSLGSILFALVFTARGPVRLPHLSLSMAWSRLFVQFCLFLLSEAWILIFRCPRSNKQRTTITMTAKNAFLLHCHPLGASCWLTSQAETVLQQQRQPERRGDFDSIYKWRIHLLMADLSASICLPLSSCFLQPSKHDAWLITREVWPRGRERERERKRKKEKERERLKWVVPSKHLIHSRPTLWSQREARRSQSDTRRMFFSSSPRTLCLIALCMYLIVPARCTFYSPGRDERCTLRDFRRTEQLSDRLHLQDAEERTKYGFFLLWCIFFCD